MVQRTDERQQEGRGADARGALGGRRPQRCGDRKPAEVWIDRPRSELVLFEGPRRATTATKRNHRGNPKTRFHVRCPINALPAGAGPAWSLGLYFSTMKPSRDIARLIEIMAALRTPGPAARGTWSRISRPSRPTRSRKPTRSPTRSRRGDLDDLQEELGDLLLQVVFHARMAEEEGSFDFGDVVQAITDKLIRRHPHVFGDNPRRVAGDAKELWEQIKAEEEGRTGRREGAGTAALAGCRSPAARAHARPEAAAQGRQGRLRLERPKSGDRQDPRGDGRNRGRDRDGPPGRRGRRSRRLLFAVVNLARHLGVDPEAALRDRPKFERRFAAIEQALAKRGKSPNEATLAEMDALWDEAKEKEKKALKQTTVIPGSLRS